MVAATATTLGVTESTFQWVTFKFLLALGGSFSKVQIYIAAREVIEVEMGLGLRVIKDWGHIA